MELFTKFNAYGTTALALCIGLGAFVVHMLFAYGVWKDKKDSEYSVLVDQWVWALATLFGGIVVAIVYWVLHHPTLIPLRVVQKVPDEAA